MYKYLTQSDLYKNKALPTPKFSMKRGTAVVFHAETVRHWENEPNYLKPLKRPAQGQPSHSSAW